jgi:hypothetical protein
MTETRDQDREIEESTDDLVASIDATRDDMTETVEAIGDRLDPGRIVRDAKETVRDATVGKVETMTDYVSDVASDAGATIQATGGGLLETIRRNPVPAALAAVGIGWLVTHRSEAPRQTRTAWDRDRSPGRSSMHDPRGSSRSGQTDDGPPVIDEVGRAAGELGTRARSSGSQVLDIIEREPLAAGAVAVAVGTAVGLLLPATGIEQDVIGPAGQRVLDAVEDAASSRLPTGQEQPTSATASRS